MFSKKLKAWRFVYTAIPGEDQVSDQGFINHRAKSYWGSWIPTILIVILFIITGSIGYFTGLRKAGNEYAGLLAPAGSIKQDFFYNLTFAQPPTNRTFQAWQSLFPKNGGFIHHPILAQNFSGIAVFHQLHCLQALYNLYYQVEMHHGPHDEPLAPGVHARHCFDYLRQTLMCHADTNIESYDFKLDGVTGWGSKMCRDYRAVVDFANEWGGSKYADIS